MKHALAIGLLLALAGCENPFSPRGPYTPRLVIYAVLSNTRDVQFIRVSSTFNPPEVAAQVPDSGLAGQDVRIISGASVFVFRDTLLHAGPGRDIHAYVCDSLPIVHGSKYRLEVQSDSLGGAVSTVTIPGVPTVKNGASIVYPLGTPITVTLGLSSVTRGCLMRMYVEFSTFQDPDSLRLMEVPFFVTDSTLSDPHYPAFHYVDRSSFSITYPGEAYYNTMAKIVHTYSILVKFRNIVFQVYQVGEPLQDYSEIINGFRDELSLRSDEPDYTNITGGLGLFGGYTRDEIRVAYPANFYFNPDPGH